MNSPKKATVGIIGAGPLGIEFAIACKKKGIDYLLFDKGQAAQMIYNFPPQTHFFSSSERINISGIPIQTVDQQKCSREAYLAYIRSIIMKYNLKLNTYEEVFKVHHQSSVFELTTKTAHGEHAYHVQFLVFASGGTSHPRLLNIPGESLDHVSTKMEDPHKYFQKKVLVIGGKNSAVESALRCYHAGAHVSIALRGTEFSPQSIKYWLLPEIESLIKSKEIHCYYETEVLEIQPNGVVVQKIGTDHLDFVEADFVIKAIGFIADMHLMRQLGVHLSEHHEAPHFNQETQETNITNCFVLGTVVAGTQNKYRIFIENTHIHVEKIIDTLCKRLDIPLEKYKTSPRFKTDQLEE